MIVSEQPQPLQVVVPIHSEQKLDASDRNIWEHILGHSVTLQPRLMAVAEYKVPLGISLRLKVQSYKS